MDYVGDGVVYFTHAQVEFDDTGRAPADECLPIWCLGFGLPPGVAPGDPGELYLAGRHAFAAVLRHANKDLERQRLETLAELIRRSGAAGSEERPLPPSPNVLEPEPKWVSTPEAASLLGLDRKTLDAMVKRAPTDLPGGPVVGGVGLRRRTFRWQADRVVEWAEAYRAWDLARKAKPVVPTPAATRAPRSRRKAAPDTSQPIDLLAEARRIAKG